MKLKFKKLHSMAIIPEYKTKGAAGFDFVVYQDQIMIAPRGRKAHLIGTGLAVEIPEGYEMQIRQRSGLTLDFPNYLANSVGTIDSDYRGEIKFPIINYSTQIMFLHRGDRIMQGIISKVSFPHIIEVDELSNTTRGSGGFGSTNKPGHKGV